MQLISPSAATSFKRKFPRRKFNGYIGVLHRGEYNLTVSAVLGEGGLAFHMGHQLPSGTLVVVTFKIPGHNLVSVRGEIRNTRKLESNEFFHGIQFFSLPIEDRRKIRSYVSARLQNEELV